MTKADDARELAGYVAPIVRGTSETLLRRRVKTYDRETGEVTGEVTMRQVIGGLAEVTKLEIEVIDGRRPKHFTCDGCGKVFRVPKCARWFPVKCSPCRAGGQTVCPCGCGMAPPSYAFVPATVARRRGAPWRCPPSGRALRRELMSAMTQEQRASMTRAAIDARRAKIRAKAWHAAVIATIDAVLLSLNGGAQKTGADD